MPCFCKTMNKKNLIKVGPRESSIFGHPLIWGTLFRRKSTHAQSIKSRRTSEMRRYRNRSKRRTLQPTGNIYDIHKCLWSRFYIAILTTKNISKASFKFFIINIMNILIILHGVPKKISHFAWLKPYKVGNFFWDTV